MKKIFAIAAMAAMLIACGDEKPENKPQGGDTPTPDPEPEFVAAITVDGQFADWDAVEVDEIALKDGNTYGKTALKKVKFYTDEMYINVYVEFDPAEAMALCVYFDVDADATTGRGEPCQGIELYLDGMIADWTLNADETAFIEPRISALAPDMTALKYTGENGATSWTWEELLGAGNGFAVGSTPVAVGANEAFEMAIVKELSPMPFGEQVGIAVSLSNFGWAECGTLPQYSNEELAADETIEGRAACHILNL